jgi:hypothetical protein
MLVLALADLVLGVGLFVQAPWATALWPFTEQPLDYVVLSSFLVAGFGTVLWIGRSQEWGALRGALLDVALFTGGAAVWLAARYATDGDSAALVRAGAFAVATVAELALLARVWRVPIRDTRPADLVLRASFALFALVLLLSGGALLLRLPIWPWQLAPASSTLLGFLFAGSCVYFLHGLARPSWHAMKGQLVAFLLYDAVLVQPYLSLDQGYKINHTSLAVYWAVIAGSAALSVWYLFLNPRTRSWAVDERR